MGDQAQTGVTQVRRGDRRSLARLLLLTLAVGLIGVTICVLWKPLAPPGRVQFDGREYRVSGAWSEYQARFPDIVDDPEDMERVGGPGLGFKAILTSTRSGYEGTRHTVICVQSFDGEYWTYELVGGP